jgi:hypothetical protein
MSKVAEYSWRCLAEQMSIPRFGLRTVNQASGSVFRRLYRVDASALLARMGLSPSIHGTIA